MVLQQYYLSCLAQASYLIADPTTGNAVVVDPRRDVELYLAEAEKNGWKIEHVYLTHFHADFLAGHLELRERTGAKIHLGAKAEAEFDFVAESDGAILELGPNVRIEALETPGHTPESISLMVFDAAVSEVVPQALLTGDALFIGDVGRPDLLASIGYTQEELGRMLYDSLHNKILKLSDQVMVYPAHGAGSMCGKNLSSETSSTIGEQRRNNYALQPMTPEEFLAVVTADQPTAPAYFQHDAQLNRQEFPNMERALQAGLKSLSLGEVLAQANHGAQLVDVRDGEEFAREHLAGSLNIGLEGKYATWAGTLLDLKRPIILIVEEGQEREAVLRLGRIGLDTVIGVLERGSSAWEGRSELLGSFERWEPSELLAQLQGPDAPQVLDVRTSGEHHSCHFEGAVNIPLQELSGRVDEIDAAKKLVIHCASGYRSVIAASLLKSHGLGGLRDLRGGIEAWAESELPLVHSSS